LTNAEVEQMGHDEPGSAAEYLRLRREELEIEAQERREAEDEREFAEAFVAAGGERSAAREAYRHKRNEDALAAASRADEDASTSVRRHISGRL
jgi:hypothetical protein